MADLSVMYSSKTDQWSTPQDFYQSLDDEFHFDLDPCADATNYKCDTYFTKEEDGLLQDWGGHRVFCNPPMAKQSAHGWRSVMKKVRKTTLWSSC